MLFCGQRRLTAFDLVRSSDGFEATGGQPIEITAVLQELATEPQTPITAAAERYSEELHRRQRRHSALNWSVFTDGLEIGVEDQQDTYGKVMRVVLCLLSFLLGLKASVDEHWSYLGMTLCYFVWLCYLFCLLCGPECTKGGHRMDRFADTRAVFFFLGAWLCIIGLFLRKVDFKEVLVTILFCAPGFIVSVFRVVVLKRAAKVGRDIMHWRFSAQLKRATEENVAV